MNFFKKLQNKYIKLILDNNCIPKKELLSNIKKTSKKKSSYNYLITYKNDNYSLYVIYEISFLNKQLNEEELSINCVDLDGSFISFYNKLVTYGIDWYIFTLKSYNNIEELKELFGKKINIADPPTNPEIGRLCIDLKTGKISVFTGEHWTNLQ